jgi:hypothetical protein
MKGANMTNSTSINTQEKSMIVDARLTENEAKELYEAAQRLRACLSQTFGPPLNLIKDDVLLLCNFIQENI